MSRRTVIPLLSLSFLLSSSASVLQALAADVETVGDLTVHGVVESTSGGFKFPNGTTLTDVGNISANSSSTAFQVTQSGSGHAIDATSMSGDAVHASAVNTGIYGESSLSNGILGFTNAGGSSNAGVFGSSHGAACGVYGQATTGGIGVRGSSSSGDAIHGESNSSTGVYGQSQTGNGVLGFTNATSRDIAGIFGSSHGTASGIYGQSTSDGFGVRGSSSTGDAIHGESSGTGVYGASTGSVGVLGYTTARGAQNAGVRGLSQSDANGVYGEGTSTGPGVYGENSDSGYGVVGYASGSASLAAGRFASSSTSGTALIAESPLNTQVMKVDAKGIHAGPGMTGTPLAYGRFNSTGTRTVGSSNISCGWDGNRYQCTISGEDYFYGNYVTIVTPNLDLAIPVVGSSVGKLLISFYNISGSLIQPTGFSVTVYKP